MALFSWLKRKAKSGGGFGNHELFKFLVTKWKECIGRREGIPVNNNESRQNFKDRLAIKIWERFDNIYGKYAIFTKSNFNI